MSTRSILIWPVLGRKEVVEYSEQSFTVRFLSARALSAPGTARYKLISKATGAIIVDWTVITTPGSEETIVIDADDNIIRAGRDSEPYELTVQSDYDDVTEMQTAYFRYRVKDLEAVTA